MTSGKRAVVLAADDDLSAIDALTHILNPDYRVLRAQDNESVLRLAQIEKPGLILLGIQGQTVNGAKVIGALRADEAIKNIPVIFITGQDSVKDECKGLSLGAVDCIKKPFDMSVVRAHVDTHMRLGAYICSMERLCCADALTGLSNRRMFDRQLAAEWNRAARNHRPLSVLMMDLDRFKWYNDHFGHMQGDILLQNAAAAFESAAKRPTDLVSRWGGDEFAVLLPDTNRNGAERVAARIRQTLRRIPFVLSGGTEVYIGVSIGMNTAMPKTGEGITEFLTRADEALYAVKSKNDIAR